MKACKSCGRKFVVGRGRFTCDACVDVRRDLDREADVVRRYLAGETIRAIAGTYGCSFQNIDRIVRLSGVPRRGQKRRVLDVRKLIEMYVGGMTLAQTGEAFGISGNSVSDILQKSGVPRRNSWRDSRIDSSEVRKLRENGSR